jgi:two-component system chemotaxis response regulator CheY
MLPESSRRFRGDWTYTWEMAEKKWILVVDDSASVRRQIRDSLEAEGLGVREAENGERGMEAILEGPVDLMIVDVNMPVMDGLEMISKVRATKEHKDTPIFVLTTESGASAARHGKAVGATAWIVKPVRGDVLIKGIRGVLRV